MCGYCLYCMVIHLYGVDQFFCNKYLYLMLPNIKEKNTLNKSRSSLLELVCLERQNIFFYQSRSLNKCVIKAKQIHFKK